MPAAKECPSSMFPATASTSCLYLHSIIRPPEMASASVAFFRRFVYNGKKTLQMQPVFR